MVKVVFKMSDRGTVDLDPAQAMPLSQVLEQVALKLGEKVGGVIAVRNGKVMGLDDIVEVDDEIILFPALSGG